MFGYKATDEDMMCRGHKFELGVWYEVEGKIELCGNGFHFCEQPSGVWSYYGDEVTRVFKCEADGEVVHSGSAGADRKSVARRIRLIEEVCIGGNYNTGDCNAGNFNTGDYNTGNRNTGDYNTGHRNTGHRNAGNCNAGNFNTGDRNIGDLNTGDRNTGNSNTGNYNTGGKNTGHKNTGDLNTGDYNTGDYNTGYRNIGDLNTGDYNTGNSNTGSYSTGHCNTGDKNTGDCNTGYGNATDYSSGMFCVKETTVLSFDVRTKLTMREYCAQYPEYRDLCRALQSTDPIDFELFSRLPGITKRKLKALHDKHLSSNSPDSGETE